MKKVTILFLLIVLSFNFPVLGQYTVKLRIGEIVNPVSPGHPYEWGVTLYADIFDANKNLVPHSSNFYYYWYKDECTGGGFQTWHNGFDLYFLAPDGHNSIPSACDETITFQTYWVQVTVKINGILYYSGDIRVPDDESGVLTQKEINITQKRESQSVVEDIGKRIGTGIFNYPAPFIFYTPSTQNSEIFRGSQELVSNPYEKYNHWLGISDVVNHRTITLSGSTINLTSQFGKVYDATVRANLLEVPGTYDDIQFMDPWFINDNSDPLGLRNKGTSADFLSVEYSSNNVGINTQYKGILLNQEYDPIGQNPFYKVRTSIQPYNIFLQQTGRYHKFYFQNWSSSGTDPLTQNNIVNGYYETPVVFRSSGAVVNANLKGTQLSSEQNGYSPSNQRKFVKTIGDDGLHHVYSSLGHVWYEQSTDGGETWTIANGGNYIDNGEGKLPAIDESGYYYYDPSALVVYQEKNGNNYKIKLKRFYDGVQSSEFEIHTSSQSYTVNANPVVAYSWETQNGHHRYLVVYQSSDGLHYTYGYINSGVIYSYETGIINGTDQNSINPTIAARKNTGGQGDFYLAWQQNNNQIYYKKIHYVDGEITDDPAPTLYSYNDGFTYNWLPSISIVYGPPYYPLISWVGHNGTIIEKIVGKEDGVNKPAQETKIVVKRGTTGNYFIAGNNVNNVNNNSTSESAENSVIVWSEGTPVVSKWVRRMGTIYSTTANLSNSGIENQVSNGNDLENIKAMVFNTESTPFYFKQASTNFCYNCDMQKITASEDGLTFGRTGIVGKGDVQFVFNVGDIILADTSVQFIPKPDTLLYISTDELNQNTHSLTFHLNNQSQLFFTDYYYTVNSEIADSVLSDNDAVSFRVELVNANTNTVVGTFDEITYTRSNLEEHDNINYQVDCSGIEEGDYFLRLVTTVVGDASYNLANVQNDDPELEKRTYNQVSFKGNEIPAVYELSQNFPNPFNPSTTIKYQIPQDGLVILRIYDVLGAEVATLVNEERSVGRYDVNFNASSLASGVYIYRIQVNDFVDVKKMILLR